MKSVQNYIRRLAALNVRNMWAVAGVVGVEGKRSRLVIILDMMWCSIRYQAGYLDYQEFEFYSLSGPERATWITSGNANSIVVKFNQRAFRPQFADKAEFNKRFQPHLGREWLDVRESTPREVEEFVCTHGAVMAKVLDGMSGAGVEKYLVESIDNWDDFTSGLIENRQFLLEAFIVQHPRMAALSPTSINSLRMITFFDGNTVHVLEAVLRMGNGADVDNYGRGGMYTVLDEKSGIAHYGAFDKQARTYITHPITGIPITGFAVPLYDEVLELLEVVARMVPQIPYVGWDIAIGPSHPLVIEGNYNTGVFQMKPSLTGIKTGLLPRFRSVIDF